MQRRSVHRVVLYSRAGCHLCDVARETILTQRERLGFEFEEVDVEADEELELEYGIRIPVVEVDGEEAFEITVDAARLARLVG
ncbi:MAG TPA: glutaredoxin family protein [Actinomycetota bacterium]|nr:glutaredoxin family protein [Actinomycetota bacterium]